MQTAKAEAEQKEEAFDEEAWIKEFFETNPPIEVGE